jgi:hypothetical protein
MRGEVMKIVVVGGTGLIGSKVIEKLKQKGHEAIAAAPNTGVNTITGEGLKEAMAGGAVGRIAPRPRRLRRMAPPLTGSSLIPHPPTGGKGSMKRILCSLLVATLPFGSVLADAPKSKNAKASFTITSCRTFRSTTDR